MSVNEPSLSRESVERVQVIIEELKAEIKRLEGRVDNLRSAILVLRDIIDETKPEKPAQLCPTPTACGFGIPLPLPALPPLPVVNIIATAIEGFGQELVFDYSQAVVAALQRYPAEEDNARIRKGVYSAFAQLRKANKIEKTPGGYRRIIPPKI